MREPKFFRRYDYGRGLLPNDYLVTTTLDHDRLDAVFAGHKNEGSSSR